MLWLTENSYIRAGETATSVAFTSFLLDTIFNISVELCNMPHVMVKIECAAIEF